MVSEQNKVLNVGFCWKSVQLRYVATHCRSYLTIPLLLVCLLCLLVFRS
ncbi:hypothetical protein EVA_15263 [gut metagenome]|uniref:Uncharacterized protein n=1 Tax=gut metagenome TaxID=749906 RepID=J9C9Q6_9ZZZZ